MSKTNLACCVVRDLLPSYIEGLTETETAAMVKEHIDACPTCQQMEQDMRRTVPVESFPKRELKFLRRIRRTRLLAAILSFLVALWCIWWLYDQTFHYPNTEAGRLAAVEDYIPLPEDSRLPGVQAGTPLSVGAWAERDGHLFIFYFADDAEHVYGVMHLVRGLNGKYQILEAGQAPSSYSAGIYGGNLNPRGTDWDLYYLAGYHCRDIYRAEVEFVAWDADGITSYTAVKSIDLSGENFLELLDQDALKQELGFTAEEPLSLDIKNVELFDKNGENITAAYTDTSPSTGWGSGKGTAETFLVYVYMGIVALLGLTLIRYFLRRD